MVLDATAADVAVLGAVNAYPLSTVAGWLLYRAAVVRRRGAWRCTRRSEHQLLELHRRNHLLEHRRGVYLLEQLGLER